MKRYIIHINGVSGAGKTTLGNKLKDKFKNKIIVVDLDDLFSQYVEEKFDSNYFILKEKFKSKEYQKWLDKYFNSLDKKTHLIITGLNNNYWLDKNFVYELNATHKFYIKIKDELALKNRCNRSLIKYFQEDKDKLLKKMFSGEKMNEKIIKKLQRDIYIKCSYKDNMEKYKKWNKLFKQNGYKFMERENIFDFIVKLIK